MDNQNVSDDEFDEVSLPGVGDNEQPTILEVLNRGIVNTEDENATGTGIEPTKQDRNSADTQKTIKVTSTVVEGKQQQAPENDKESDILVRSSSSSKDQSKLNEPQRSQLIDNEENVFDIESHLIETLNNYSVSEDSELWGVDIKELPPVEGESSNRTSKIETDSLVGTVFEVEPATPKILKPVEISVPEPKKQSVIAQDSQDSQAEGKGDEEPIITAKDQTKEDPKDSTIQTKEVEKEKVSKDSAGQLKIDEESITTPEDKQTKIAQKADKVETADPIESKIEDLEPSVPKPQKQSSNAQIEESSKDSTVCGKSEKEPTTAAEEISRHSTVQDKSDEESIISAENKQTEIAQKGDKEVEDLDPIESKIEIAVRELEAGSKSIWTIVKEIQSEFGAESIRSTDTKAPVEVFPTSSGVGDKPCHKVEHTTKEVTGDVDGRSSVDTDSKDVVDEAAATQSIESSHKLKGEEVILPSNKESVEKPLEKVVLSPESVELETKKEDPTEPQTITNAPSTTKSEIDPSVVKPNATLEIAVAKTNGDIKTEPTPTKGEESATLTQEIDQKLSELTTHLNGSSKVDLNGNLPKSSEEPIKSEDTEFDVNGLPLPKTALEVEQRQEFLDSLPQISLETDSNKVAALAKREYYQSLRQYLITHSDKPPVPPETYRWEDLKRAKTRGGYPWTHLYKRPLGPDEEPEIVLLLRKSQELRFASESPKSFKKVRIDDQVSIKETERYIQELSDAEDNPTTEDEAEEENEDERSECISCVSDSVLTVEKRASKLGKIRGILKKRSPRKEQDAKSLPDTTTSAPSTSLAFNHNSEEDLTERHSRPHNKAKCFPIMKKLKSMADRQKKNFRNIKKISLKKDEKISLEEEQKIIKLKTSPKAERTEIPRFIEKQDSDDVLEIVELDESPSRKRKDQLDLQEQASSAGSAVLVPDEIIEIPSTNNKESERQQTPEPTVSEILEEELKSDPVFEAPPKKTARLRREHVYEDIADNGDVVNEEIKNILDIASVEALKQSLAKQDFSTVKDVESAKAEIPLERMGSSEEEVERTHLAPISSIDSTSDDERTQKPPLLTTVAEESDVASNDGVVSDKEDGGKLEAVPEVTTEHIPWSDIELKPALKKEASPSPSDKKVTFSHVEDEAEPHREDIELPEGFSGIGPKRWSNLSDHEYEPIGEPSIEIQSQPTSVPLVSALKKEASPAPSAQETPKLEISQPSVEEAISDEASSPSKSDELREIEELQKDIEDRYFSSAATTPRTESRTDYEVHTSQVDSSALEELPLKPENRKKGFMASAQDRTRKMQAGLKNQAGKIKTKFRSPRKVPSGSPKAKERKRFKAPEFSKIKMPEMKRPDLSGFKRPEFTKFSKPDMSKFKLPDKFSSLKLTRSKSFKEPSEMEDTTVSGTTPESTSPPAAAPAKKQRFDFSFGTYPRAFRKKNKPEVVESTVDEPSVILTTETQPSAESSSTPQGDRGPGPVRSRWADKFSDVSYNDSEGSRYRRYGSEIESSFDRESSMERRMKEVLDENAKEEAELAMLGVVEQKQFADYDEENRVIHEISKTREGEFKRRPMVHQDSDLVSEEGRDVGWTERDAERNRILRQAELEAEERLKYLSERSPEREETQSTASSKKFVFEEINDDEFLLRNKGISQEFNMINRNWLDPDIEEDIEPAPSSNLKQIVMQRSSSNERMDFGYDVPPPKPRRLSQQQRRRHYDSENASQVEEYADDISLSQAGSDNYTHPAPSRPLRKGRSKTSQEISIGGTSSVQMNDKEWIDQEQRDQDRILPQDDEEEKENIQQEWHNDSPVRVPQAPRRRRKLQRDSVDKDSYANGFGGRSVSNSFLKEDNKPEEVIVYRTEHEYKIPLATPENYTDTSNTPRKSRSLSRLGADDDDRTSHGVDSLANAHLDEEELQEKYIIEMMENDGYAVVRKENLPKPTPPARRKKFSRSPGERFATMPHLRRCSPSVQEHKPASRDYSTIGRPTPPRRKSALSLGADSQKDLGIEEFTDYEIPDVDDRTESPRNLQSGAIINKMKYRPLPPPPRPPREKRQIQRDRHGDDDDEFESRDNRDDRDGGGERTVFDDYHEQSSDDYNLQQNVEVEVSTQTDPLPDDFVCEEFEITDDMKVIEPRRTRTLDEILKDEEEADLQRAREIDEEVLLRGIQRFREANQRSASEKSRASSQAKSLSRPQTPSAILIEKRVPTPVPNSNGQTVLEASLVVQPIDDLDLEEELLRREGLYDGSHSKSDADSRYRDDEDAGHGSEEENARIGEEEHSYTRSTDAESQKNDDEREDKLREQFLEEQRLQDERDEEIKQRLLRQLEEEERLLAEEEQALRLLEEEEENERRLQEEEEEKQKLRNELERKQRLRADITTEQPESNEDEKNERLKTDDSYELKSEISEERQISPAPSPPLSPSPPPVEAVISVSHEEKLQSQQIPPEPKLKDEPDEERLSPPPTAPPRKRSYGAGVLDDEPLTLAEQQRPLDVDQPRGVLPSHLALADLEVERLRVHALQAGQIMVSSLHGAQIHADELECRSGNLVVRNIELPPGFIEDIVERVRSTEREHSQAGTQTAAEVVTQTEGDFLPAPPIPRRQSDVPPVRPPPPQRESVFPSEYLPTAPTAPLLHSTEPSVLPRTAFPPDYLQSGPPIGFYNHRNSDNEGEPAPPVYRRRRHHRRRDSSSEDEHQSRRSRSARPEQQQQQSVAQAGRQFISACSLPLANVINQLTNAVRPNNDNKQDQGQPRNISPVVVLFIVMTLGFLIYLLSGKNIHHHHWDYFNPPGNDGRLS